MDKDKNLTFELDSEDTQTGEKVWAVNYGGQQIGTIEKNTEWCGDGYRASSYSVILDSDGEEDVGAEFYVANIWSRGEGVTARQAFAACKAFVRDHFLAR